MLASPSLCGNERVTHQEATTCLQLVKHAAVSACSLSAAYPTGRPRSPCPGRGANATATRQRPSLSLRTRDCRSQIGGCRPLAQREFLPCVTCDYQTRYSYFYSCTLYCRSLQISHRKYQLTAGRLPLPLSNLYLHTARVGLWTDRLEAATGDLRFFVCRFVSRCVMYGRLGSGASPFPGPLCMQFNQRYSRISDSYVQEEGQPEES